MRFAVAVLGAVVLGLAGAAGAQPLADPEAAIVEELVVTAREPGPAWWRVEDADTTVWILGVAEDGVPAGVSWDRRWLERRIKGANGLIVGTRVSLTGGLRDIPALLRARSSLKSKTPLEETLPPALEARFVAARERIGQPASRYAGWQPMIAGQMLVGDAGGKGKRGSVTEAAVKLAKKNKVKVVEAARYDAVPIVREAMGGLTPAVHHQCLGAALDDVEAPPARGRAAVEGWARGDTAAALLEPRSFDKCLLLLGGGAELWRRMTRDNAAAIVKALETPGHAVAVVSLRPWLAEGGIAAQVEARGVKVKGPGEA